MKKQFLLMATIATIFAACKKDDITPTPIVITTTTTDPSSISVKENSIYVSLDTAIKSITIIPLKSWDIALQSGPNGLAIELNSGAGIYGSKSTATDITKPLTGSTVTSDWKFTPPSGDFTKSMFKGYTQDSIYLVGKSSYDATHQLTFSTVYKFKILNSTAINYKIVFGTPEATTLDTITVSKTSPTGASKILVSFATKALSAIQPPAPANYDIILTSFIDTYTAMGVTQPTLLTGVFLNYGAVMGNLIESSVADANKTAYENITMANTPAQNTFTAQQDLIGSNWKDYDYTLNKYVYKDKYVYCLYNMTKHSVYKVQFQNYLNATGASGYISFRSAKL